MNYYALYPDELYHYGTKGMHWGIRQYQNSDGTLTALGRIHYGVKGFYDGPQMDRVRSSIKRGWYTANDPEFLGRKMSDVKAKYGAMAEYASTSVKKGWKIANDPLYLAQQVEKFKEKFGYNDNNKSPNANPQIEPYQEFSARTKDGKSVFSTSDVYSLEGGIRTQQEDWYNEKMKLNAIHTGNTLLYTIRALETAQNVKMSDLAKFDVTDTTSDEYVPKDRSNLKLVTRTFESQGPYSVSLSSALDPSGHMIYDDGKTHVEYEIPTGIDMKTITDIYNKNKKWADSKMVIGDPINAETVMSDLLAYAERRKAKKDEYIPYYEKKISDAYRRFYSS